MNNNGKRSRSPGDNLPPGAPTQRKVYVDEQLMEQNDAERMQLVHERTRQLLFNGAKMVHKTGTAASTTAVVVNENNNNVLTNKDATVKTKGKLPLYVQYVLRGDGTVTLSNVPNEDDYDPPDPLVTKRSICCMKLTSIHDKCGNCTMPLCEECGYSCEECYQFICRSCVVLFGKVSDDERPLCEKCQMYLA